MSRTRTVPMTSATCMVVGCDRPYSAMGYCHGHYHRKREEQTGPVARYKPTLTEPPGETLIALFNAVGWTMEEGNGCWLWAGTIDTKFGYGRLYIPKGSPQYPGRRVMAHRLSHEIHNGLIPAGFAIQHACDIPACVNPGHLTASTQSDNIKDMWRKGRASKERLLEMNDRAREAVRKISEDDVRQIRRRHAGGELQKDLAAEFGISGAQVSKIITRLRWAHVA